MKLQVLFLFLLLFFGGQISRAEDGYRLWLRYDKIEDRNLRNSYSKLFEYSLFEAEGEIAEVAKKEFSFAIKRMLELKKSPLVSSKNLRDVKFLAGILGKSKWLDKALESRMRNQIGEEGFGIFFIKNKLYLLAADEKGLLYGTFQLLQKLQRHESLKNLALISNPKVKLRLLNHWDNLDGTVERGYAGFSLWNWHQLPENIDSRYTDYARVNASIGINGSVVTNVNANSLIFRSDYLKKVKALADVFRPYGIKIYLTARFSSPMETGGLDTADPLDPEVKIWWKNKAAEVYKLIPDFGGFLVKANSEGQPGPQQFGRTHADGANMLAEAVKPFGGVVIWRAFVYSEDEPEDRAKQAYNEFVVLDGKFLDNVLVQVKNGPIDFQPREPIHPLFGAMPQTPVMMEFQITKEYLGQGTHLVGLANMYEEILQTDSYVQGNGSLVARVVDGSLNHQKISGISGVSNIGHVRNWTGNLFGQADWYAFGRLAWDPYLLADDIYADWAKLSFSHNDQLQQVVRYLLKESYEACVNYMTPLGLHHIMAAGHHYGPGPWVSDMPRADWTSVYYHKADANGLGFDRTVSGSNALEQYSEKFRKQFEDPDLCPLPFLLWFHHVSWNKMLSNGNNVWEELCLHYQKGVDQVNEFRQKWISVDGLVDPERYKHVAMHLEIQQKEAQWWRDACIAYFQQFSRMPLPQGLKEPEHKLDYYISISYPYAPGIRPRW